MSRFTYYLNYFVCLVVTLIAFELCWIGAKYVIEGEVVHTYLDHFIAVCGSWYLTRDTMRLWLKYVRVELFNPIGEPSEATAEYTARQFTVANEVSENSGAGGEKISVTGTLHAVGDPVLGKFDTVTKKFTAGDFKGKYDTAAAG